MSSPVILVTAGPSREPIDDIRFLSNSASGTLGIEVARAAAEAGWESRLAIGPGCAPPPPGVEPHPFVTARELDSICARLWPRVDVLVATAAVSDFRPAERIPGKRKKDPDEGEEWALRLVRNPDVLANRAAEKGDRVLVGFALESPPDLQEARRKRMKKRLDLILLNTPASLGGPEGDYTWIEAGGRTIELGRIAKRDLAERILRFAGDRLLARRGGAPRPPEER